MAVIIKDMRHPERYAKVTAAGKLETTASFSGGDIEIGAVEIKDHTTDVRQSVTTVGSTNISHVGIFDSSGNQINSFGGGGSVPSAIVNGNVNVTTAGTAVPLSGSSVTIAKVTVKAKSTNTGNIYLGNSSVTSSNGLDLSAGESVEISIDDLSKAYIDADTNGEGITYIGG